MNPDVNLDEVLEDTAPTAAAANQAGPARCTMREWKTLTRHRRRWHRRAALATVAVILAEASVAVAWNALAAALSARYPDVS